MEILEGKLWRTNVDGKLWQLNYGGQNMDGKLWQLIKDYRWQIMEIKILMASYGS